MPAPAIHPAAEKRILNERYPNLITLRKKGKAKCRRHDSNDRESTLVQIDGISDYVWIGSKRTAPQIFAENDHGWSAGFAVLRQETASRERLPAEEREKLRRDDRCVHDGRLAAGRQRKLVFLTSRHLAEDAVAFAQSGKIQ